MPIRRPNNNDPDWMARMQDKELIYLEERISALYEEASHDVTEEYERFFTDYQLEYNNRLAMVESGEMTEDAFQNWCRHRIFQDNRYQAMIRMLTDVLVNADVAAMAAVNEQLPYTLAESYDFISSLGFEAADQAGISMGTFQIYNADSVQAIIRDNPDLLPVVDLPEDELWNRNHINNEITQAIIRGDSMQQVARRLQNVAQMDNNAAIRNARTSMTAAENLGRSESARRLKEKGLPVDEVWSATHDARTRDSHLLLDGTRRDEKTGKFGVGIIEKPYLRFPADPEGQAKEIYNCRCRLNVQIAGIDHSKDGELYEQFMRENYPEDWEKIQQRRADISTGEGRREVARQEALERQARLREERASEAQANAQPVFTPARSIAEAEEYASRFADNVDFRGVSLENANSINEALTNLTSKYPIEKLDRISQNSRGKALAKASGKTLIVNGKNIGTIEEGFNREAIENQIRFYQSMYPSGRIPRDIQSRIRHLENRLRYSRWSVSRTYENQVIGTITHEYGHIIADQYFGQINDTRYMTRSSEWRVFQVEWRDIFSRAKKNEDIYAISAYSATDEYEFFAECFCARENGETLPDYVEDFMRRLLNG